jgi:diguanylate cyclase (GGDEF)-like protein
LRDCAVAWNKVLREQDLLGRLGGEEFCAVLPETPLAAARLAARRLRASVAALEFAGRGGGFTVTVSVGVSCLGGGDNDLATLIERSDRALYVAKEGGRDRVETLEAV